MAATTRKCPQCGKPLTPASADKSRLTCKSCGLRFGARPKKAALASTVAGDRRLRLALLVGGGLAFVFLGLLGTAAAAVVLWARSHSPTPTVAVAADTPTAPAVSDTGYHPISAPAADDPPPAPPTKKPAPPKDDLPPVASAPPVIPPPADPAPPLDPKPTPDPALNPAPAPPADPKPMPDPAPMPAPEVKPAADPINRAIDKAVANLKQQMAGGGPVPGPRGFAGGNQVGVMGLIGLALLESGVPADDPAVTAAVDAVRNGAPACANTYEMAIAVWCLDRLGDPKDEDLIRDLGARLVAGQLGHGKWTYSCPGGGAAGPAPPGFGPVPGLKGPANPAGLGMALAGPELTADQIKELMETLAKYDPATPIPAKKQLAPVCRFVRGKKVEAAAPGQAGFPGFDGGGDLSLTQFAVLGLWVARKHHVPVDRSLLLAEAFVRANQSADGGWAYHGRAVGAGRMGLMGTTDSMTCSGLMELAIGRGVGHSENAKTEAADPQFEKGLIYLADLFGRGIAARQKDVKADPKEVQNQAAVSNKLLLLYGPLNAHALLDQHALWLKDLAAFHAEVDKSLALDLPADAKKDLEDIDGQIKKYKDAPADRKKAEKEAVDQLLQQSSLLQPAGGMRGFAFGGPGRLLRPGKNNRMNMDDIYCLWSLERLCMVCDLNTVAGHDWYAWGAGLLVDHQNEDGSWNGSFQPTVDTCLALLFLKRVNVAQDLTAQLRLIAPIKDLSSEKLKYISPGESPSPGLTQPSPGETPAPSRLETLPAPDAPKP